SSTHHHFLHQLPILGRQPVPHKPAVAQPHHTQPPRRVGLHDPGHALRLEYLGSLGSGRVRFPEEDEVRDVDVEVRDQVADEVPPLPQCVGAEAVDEEEVGLGVIDRVLGDPAVHAGRPVMEVCYGGSEPRFGEGGSVAPVL
ncbi:hypothetical protein TorRG33x02_002750, partial [Trema orientale]